MSEARTLGQQYVMLEMCLVGHQHVNRSTKVPSGLSTGVNSALRMDVSGKDHNAR